MTRRTIKIKYVDMPTEFDFEDNWITNALRKRYNIQFVDQPDFLFYGPHDLTFLDYDNCVKIWVSGEPASPNFNECDYALGFDHIQFGDRYIRAAAGDCMGIGISSENDYRDFDESIQLRKPITEDFFNRKFCNFIYSNPTNGDGALSRVEFCKRLMKYKHVDCPGRVLNNMQNAIVPRYVSTGMDGFADVPTGDAWILGKLDFISQYKFTIAFENVFMDGYTTEKLLHPLQAYSIPIYWGNPSVVKDFNPKAFINCNDYDNDFDKVIQRVIELDNDKEQYLAMLRESPFQPDFDFHIKEKAEEFLFHIIEKGNHPYVKDPMGWSTGKRAFYRYVDAINGMSIDTYINACKNGQVGMRSILRCFEAWLRFKLYGGK